MNFYQLSALIDSKISEYEAKAQQETNVARLNEIFDYISFLKIVKHHLDTPSSNTMTPNGRRVVSIQANNAREARAAIDLVRKMIESPDYQYGKCVEEAIYVTNEGVAWGG